MTQDTGLRSHVFWLYGVIVGLAIKEGLSEVLPHLFTKSVQPFYHLLEGARLLVFLILIIRFYLGAVKFFSDAYDCVEAGSSYTSKNYFIDFLIGFFHFLFFFALAISIDIHDRPLWLYPVLLAGILVYDVPWLAVNWYNDTYHLIKLWTFVNVGTLLVGACLYLTLPNMGVSTAKAEASALLIVLIVSLIDIGEIVTDKEIFATGLKRLTSRTPDPPISAP
ncbi:MAG: hypothetical protein QOE33_3268 [Acidobacteriota bacterium]|nr:hypothetical protein [Acidobacteriota bacterium]